MAGEVATSVGLTIAVQEARSAWAVSWLSSARKGRTCLMRSDPVEKREQRTQSAGCLGVQYQGVREERQG